MIRYRVVSHFWCSIRVAHHLHSMENPTKMEDQWRKNCVLNMVQLLFTMGRFYGMTTFTLDYAGIEGVRVRFIDVLLLIGFLIFYLILLALNVTNEIEFLDSSFTLFNTGIRYLLLYAITMVIFSVCFNFLFRHKLWNIVMKIVDVDEEVSSN